MPQPQNKGRGPSFPDPYHLHTDWNLRSRILEGGPRCFVPETRFEQLPVPGYFGKELSSMDDAVFRGGPSDTAMDLDFMDEFLLGGSWWPNASDFLVQQHSPSVFDCSNIDNSYHDEEDEEKCEESPSELDTMPWMKSASSRLLTAIGYMKDLIRNRDVLIQIWVPVKKGGELVLTTSGQPFTLDPNCAKLGNYRNISVKYEFAAEAESRVSLGLPGRVYVGKVPEWTPDVRFFTADEYPRVKHAYLCDIRGTLAVPVFQPPTQDCVGVIELVMTMQKSDYRPELQTLCNALQAVDLRSSEFSSAPLVKELHGSYETVHPEIVEVMKSACETHGLPLAQTWVPCIQQGKQGCRHSDENLVHCVSTLDSACFVSESSDPWMRAFHETCSEHHLLKGQGVAGRAFLTNQPCFSTDITVLGNTEYPLSHHARIFGLHAAVAIRLRSICSAGIPDFVLEFFLPTGCRDPYEQKQMLSSLSVIIQRGCRSLRVVTDEEVRDEILSTPKDSPMRNEPCMKAESFFSSSSSSSPEEALPRGLVCEEDVPAELSTEPDTKDKDGARHHHLSASTMPREKKRGNADKTITLETLRQHFAGSLKHAAQSLGVCPTTLKRICRQHGIKRWPSRKIRKVGHSLQKLQGVIDSVQGASGAFRISSLYSNFPQLAPIAAAPKTSASGGNSQSSCSSQSCSSGRQQHLDTPCRNTFGAHEDTFPARELVATQVRTLRASRPESSNEILPEYGGHKVEDGWRVKVGYGEEKIRFRMGNNWGYEQLVQEVVRRFNIGDISGFHLKYLDDDSEWVLLTCDADLEECIDLCKLYQPQTIKLLLQVFPS